MAHELEFEPVDDAAIAVALAGLPGWERQGIKLVKTYTHASFPAAIAFVNRVAEVAERYNHHPGIVIDFKRVSLELWTHKKNATTQADLAVAREIENVAGL
jgi:4a-hydroxytetrahydrobiopterin dehydratase